MPRTTAKALEDNDKMLPGTKGRSRHVKGDITLESMDRKDSTLRRSRKAKGCKRQ
jgi:hypothetical protein